MPRVRICSVNVCIERHHLEELKIFKEMFAEQRGACLTPQWTCMIYLSHPAKWSTIKVSGRLHLLSQDACWTGRSRCSACFKFMSCHCRQGSQIFQLRQRILVDRISSSLAFDGGSNQITITEEYATRDETKEDWDLASPSLASEMSRCSLVNPSGNFSWWRLWQTHSSSTIDSQAKLQT